MPGRSQPLSAGFRESGPEAEYAQTGIISLLGKTFAVEHRPHINQGRVPHVFHLLDTIPYLTNISLFELEQLPEPMVILGADYIYYQALLHLVPLLFLLISYMVHQLIPHFKRNK
ncbi:MAG: hypothetical protein H7069_01400 [Phormidesmis sp. FL-bin-119]|nr:hypothetical protein [Pedobacter sp.]